MKLKKYIEDNNLTITPRGGLSKKHLTGRSEIVNLSVPISMTNQLEDEAFGLGMNTSGYIKLILYKHLNEN